MRPARIAELLAPFLRAPIVRPRQFAPVEVPKFSEVSRSAERSDEEPAVLSSAQLQAISTYIDILLHWNARINLTAIRDPDHIVPRHVGESLFTARILFPVVCSGSSAPPAVKAFDSAEVAAVGRPQGTNDVFSVADVGSGAGFPGLPLKLWAPQISLTLIESNHKKATFLREVTRVLTLTDVDIQSTRAEHLTGVRFDLVTLRAVERFAAVLPAAAALVAPGGRLALLIGTPQLDQARVSLPDLSWSDPIPIPLSHSRVLVQAHRSR